MIIKKLGFTNLSPSTVNGGATYCWTRIPFIFGASVGSRRTLIPKPFLLPLGLAIQSEPGSSTVSPPS